MNTSLQIIPTVALTAAQQAAIIELCTRAYQEDFTPYLAALTDGVHVLAYNEDILVSHAMWVTRWLQVGIEPLRRTAYVEAVATEPAYQHRGYATLVLRRLADEIQTFDIGALSPSDQAFYARLGWEGWRGPLAVRSDRGLIATPDEQVMILRLPNTGPVDLHAPLSIEWRAGDEVW